MNTRNTVSRCISPCGIINHMWESILHRRYHEDISITKRLTIRFPYTLNLSNVFKILLDLYSTPSYWYVLNWKSPQLEIIQVPIRCKMDKYFVIYLSIEYHITTVMKYLQLCAIIYINIINIMLRERSQLQTRTYYFSPWT